MGDRYFQDSYRMTFDSNCMRAVKCAVEKSKKKNSFPQIQGGRPKDT